MVVFVISFWRWDAIYYGPWTQIEVHSAMGGLKISVMRQYQLSPEIFPTQDQLDKYGDDYAQFDARRNELMETNDFSKISTGRLMPGRDDGFSYGGSWRRYYDLGPKFGFDHFDGIDGNYFGPSDWVTAYEIWFPHWVLIPLLLLPGLLWIAMIVRKRRRRLRNACLTCGYDLRASKEICPECGTRFVS